MGRFMDLPLSSDPSFFTSKNNVQYAVFMSTAVHSTLFLGRRGTSRPGRRDRPRHIWSKSRSFLSLLYHGIEQPSRGRRRASAVPPPRCFSEGHRGGDLPSTPIA